ncbi:hypothetical protein [Halotia branconii]|uniref:Uncharacterized protein n=1 Tax=Halotia branconii CENA392 TaxID=1539056 RepID=A0AAJ6NQL1_9CYAN|nr:hypothetical protein [Halotia branconii]WGV24782.1 hypothetical protein QI031_23910 [Halotia branconii CENA392]
MRELQLGNSSNWEIIHNANVSAVILSKEGGGYKSVPIPEISIAVLLDVFVLAVRVSTIVPEGRTWRFAGHIKQSVSTGISAFDNQDASFNTKRPLFLDKINLVLYPKISTNYSVSIKLPDWFENAGVAVWRYTGIDQDADLTRIEAKIDAL